MIIEENFPIKQYTTFGIDAKVKRFVTLNDNADVCTFLKSNTDKNIFILGGGSNIVFTKDFQGTVLHPKEQSILVVTDNEESTTLKVSAGYEWDDFVRYTVENGLGGLENLSLIPGNVGACPVQNIGAYGVEVKDTIVEVEGFYLADTTPFVLTNEQCDFGYRDSIFKRDLKGKIIITHVSFKLSKNPVLKTTYGNIEEELKNYPTTNIETIRNAVVAIRERKLPSPKEFGNCGSFFKNPTIEQPVFEQLQKSYPNIPNYPAANNRIKIPAAWLIETSGYKGYKKGNVGVHDRQALVLINLGNATGSEVVNFADEIIAVVKKKFDIELEKEVNIL